MPASSEIDEIFAAKPQGTASKTKKKAKQSSSKRSNPETVVDSSSSRHHPKKRQKIDGQSKKSSSTQRPQHDDDRFKDSRGTGSRQKTEEGYNIYKEDELGIGNEGGGASIQFSASRLITPPKTHRCVPSTVIAASDSDPCITSFQERQIRR